MKPDPVITATDIHKHFVQGEQDLHILRGIDLTVNQGERIAIVGLSGSGKSTLLHLLGGLDSCEEGCIQINGKNLRELSEDELCRLRNKTLGFIYQFHHLMMDFTALENVMMPLRIGGAAIVQATELAEKMLDRVGLGDRLGHRPGQLSGGERQRVAIARALVTRPQCVLADEPTGALDSRTSIEIMSILQDLNTAGITIVIVTHEPDIAQYAKRVVTFRDGIVRKDTPVTSRLCASDILTDWENPAEATQ